VTAQRGKTCEHQLRVLKSNPRPLIDEAGVPARSHLRPPRVAGFGREDRQLERVREIETAEVARCELSVEEVAAL
jgi:hypothetical protein